MQAGPHLIFISTTAKKKSYLQFIFLLNFLIIFEIFVLKEPLRYGVLEFLKNIFKNVIQYIWKSGLIRQS